jgi:quercetin dioxygenase-like cupin family protein
MDLNAFKHEVKNESTWAESDRNSVTIFKSETMTIVLIAMHKNAELKTHKADGVISVQVLEGKIEFNTDQQSTQIEKGQMIILQENIMHNVSAMMESCFLLTLVMNNY